ncbi:MFS transporter [Chloroflexota bacterium]
MIVRKRFFYGYWITLVGLTTLTLTCGLIWYGFSVLNKPIADYFGWSRSEVTAAFSIFVIAQAAISPIVGRLTDKHGPRQVFFFGTIIMALALVLLSRTSAIWNFYLLYLCLGIGYVFLGAIPISIIISNWFYRLRGTMQGLAFTGIGFGGLVMTPLIGNYLLPNLGWQSVYLVIAFILSATMLPLIFFVVRNHPQQKGLLAYGQEAAEIPDKNGAKIKAATGLSVKEALGTPTFWIVGLTSAVYSMAMTGAVQNQISILNEQSFATTEAVVSIGAIGLFSAIGKFLFGSLCDRINPKYAAAISYGMVAFSLVIMIQAQSITHLWLYTVIMGLGQGGWAPNLAMLAANYFGLKHYGAVLGAIHLLFMGGSAVGPVIVGFAYDQTGSYRLIILIIAVLCFIAVPAIAIIRKPKIRQQIMD